MFESYIKMWINIFNFKGRARRRDYWYCVLINTLINLSANIYIIAAQTSKFVVLFSFLFLVFYLVAFIAGLSLSIRRLHDTGKSGWWILIGLIPIIGWIILIFWMCKKSVPKNQWGDNPLDQTQD